MLSSLTTKIALKKVGLPSDTFDLSSWTLPPTSTEPRREPNKLRKRPPPPRPEGYEDDDDDGNNGWGSWGSALSIPLTVHPWLSPAPPPVQVGVAPTVGDVAPTDRGGKLKLGGGKRTLVVFLRCVGCACTLLLFVLSI
jgi:hypothetical protein